MPARGGQCTALATGARAGRLIGIHALRVRVGLATAMKVTGPSSGPPGAPAGVGGADETKKPDGGAAAGRAEGSGKAFAEQMTPAAPAAARDAAVTGAQRPLEAATAQIAADLRAGRLQPKAAIEKVLDQVVSSQLGADAPGGRAGESVRAALQETLESDPLLAEKLAELGRGSTLARPRARACRRRSQVACLSQRTGTAAGGGAGSGLQRPRGSRAAGTGRRCRSRPAPRPAWPRGRRPGCGDR